MGGLPSQGEWLWREDGYELNWIAAYLSDSILYNMQSDGQHRIHSDQNVEPLSNIISFIRSPAETKWQHKKVN